MEYNTSREIMAIPEYGRNVQKMVEYAVNIEDNEVRLEMAKLIVEIMANMNPHIKATNDFEHRLWDHMFIISDFKLVVDGPYPPPDKKNVYRRPERLPYSEDHIRFKHYGLNLEKIIRRTIQMEDATERAEATKMIANYMKRSYLTWNRESVSDELIFAQLEELSAGKLKLGENDTLIASSEILFSNKSKRKKSNQKNKDNSGHRNKGRKK
jgi:hypothetical protein